jgi:predicted amidohydrolase YtcJ
MPGILLAIGYVALFLYLIRRSAFFQAPGLGRRTVGWLFLLKVAAGMALWWVYTYHYTDRSTADIYKYFDDGNVMFSALPAHPLDYLRMLFGIGNDTPHFNEAYYAVMNNWHRQYDTGYYNDAHTMIRFSALVRLFSFGVYHVHTVFASFLSLIGLVALYKAFIRFLPSMGRLLMAGTFLWPSVLFWGSAPIKEALLFLALGLFLLNAFRLMNGPLHWSGWIALLFGILLQLVLKSYVLFTLVPGLMALWWCRSTGDRQALLKFGAVYMACIVIALMTPMIDPGLDVLHLIQTKQQDMLGVVRLTDPGSYITGSALTEDLGSFITQAPHAVYLTFLSPLTTWDLGAMGAIGALEDLLLVLLLPAALLIRRPLRDVDLPLLFFCLGFCLLLGLLIGWTTPVVGALMRYRVPLLPFYAIALLLIADPRKTARFPFLRTPMTTSFLPLLLPLALLGSCAYKNKTADLVVRNAHIVSMDGEGHEYEAMAIKDGRIIEMGAEQQILNRYRAKKVYDAGTQTIYPGFIDGHCHFLIYGLHKQQVDLAGAKSWSEDLRRTAAYAKAHPGKGWLLGRGWDQNQWADGSGPVNDSLNILFPDRPVLLHRIDEHAAVVDLAALDSAGLTAKSSFAGGMLGVRNGKLTGLLSDNALDVFRRIIGEPDEAAKRKALLDAQHDCLNAGLTMVCIAGLSADNIALIQKMQEEGALKIRVFAMLLDDSTNFQRYAAGPYISDRLVVRAVKCFADGALGSRGALLIKPYSDDPAAGHGLQLAPREHFLKVAQWCKAHGFQMATHCIGDSANRLLLGVYGEVLGGTNDLRWRIEHAQCMDPHDLDLFGTYNIIPSVQPTHATADMLWAMDRLGPERLANAYANKRLMQQNGMIALGTDFPVVGIDPLKTFYTAVVRKNDDGIPKGGFQMKDALSRMDAMRGMTIWNALATFTEKDLGSLEVGKFADFTVVDRDLMTASEQGLTQAKVTATYINGEQVATGF